METVATTRAPGAGLGNGSVRAGARVVPVWCVVPWFSRAGEVEALLRDLGRLRLTKEADGGGALAVRLHVVLADNASAERVRVEENLRERREEHGGSLVVEQLRLAENRGGSGGFNAGMARALELRGDSDEGYVWLLDSDARATPGALLALIDVLESRPELCAAGSAIADPETGHVFEVGGRVSRRTGELGPARAGAAGAGWLEACDYVASCSALVRVACVRECGLMPDLFLHGDDVTWFIRMQRLTGRGVVGVPASVVYHPRFDRFALRGRYYSARNGLVPVRELGLGRLVALRRAWWEVVRAAHQEVKGRSDLARLTLMGLRDAALELTGPGRGLAAEFEGFCALGELGPVLEPLVRRRGARSVSMASAGELGLSDGEYASLCGQLIACGLRPTEGGGGGARPWRVVHAGVRGLGLLRAAGLILVAAGVRGGGREPGFVVRTANPIAVLWRCVRSTLTALALALVVACKWRARLGSGAPNVAAAPAGARARAGTPRAGAAGATLSIVVVSYNRWAALRGTLTRVLSLRALTGAEVIVVDNASGDASAENIEREFPEVTLLRLGENLGVSAFNRGVRAACGEVVLVLDDDAWPEPGAVERAMGVLAERPEVGAVALHPRHPATGRSEWRHAPASVARDDWPVLGCGNLVRRAAWAEVGGYEEGFFLYRNDVDLALKLLEAGWGVYFDPGWTVWHDSPGAARKSERWHRMATRNWIWLAKRHGRGAGLGGVLGGVLGWLWAHRLAGWSARRHWATVCGAARGVFAGAPPVRARAGGRHFGRLVRLSMRLTGRG